VFQKFLVKTNFFDFCGIFWWLDVLPAQEEGIFKLFLLQ